MTYNRKHLLNLVLADTKVCQIDPAKCVESIVELLRNLVLLIFCTREEWLERHDGKGNFRSHVGFLACLQI